MGEDGVECRYGQNSTGGCGRYGLPRLEPCELSFLLVPKPHSLPSFPGNHEGEPEFRAHAHCKYPPAKPEALKTVSRSKRLRGRYRGPAKP
jgi:hypothetical protein